MRLVKDSLMFLLCYRKVEMYNFNMFNELKLIFDWYFDDVLCVLLFKMNLAFIYILDINVATQEYYIKSNVFSLQYPHGAIYINFNVVFSLILRILYGHVKLLWLRVPTQFLWYGNKSSLHFRAWRKQFLPLNAKWPFIWHARHSLSYWLNVRTCSYSSDNFWSAFCVFHAHFWGKRTVSIYVR